MSREELARLVSAYFAEKDRVAAEGLRGVLADAVEESGVDPTPLRVAQHTLYCHDVPRGMEFERACFTAAEAAAYVRGSLDEEVPAGTSNVWVYETPAGRRAAWPAVPGGGPPAGEIPF